MWIGASNRSITSGTAPAGSTRFHPGMGAWFDNQFYYRATSGPSSTWATGAQRQVMLNTLASFANDPGTGGSLLRHVEIYLTWSQIEGPTQGDYSPLDRFMADIIPILQANSGTRVLYLTINMWGLRTFTAGSGGTDYYPQYALNNGWIIPIPANPNGFSGTMGLWQNPAMVAAYTAAIQNIGIKYGSNRILEAVSTQDETDMITNGAGTVDDTTWFNVYKKMQLDVKQTLPETLLWVRGNWMPHKNTPPDDEPSRFSNLINSLESAHPGGFLYGGPDYVGRNTTFQQVFRGDLGTVGDCRGRLLSAGHIEETSIGGFPNPGLIIPAQSTWAQAVLKTGSGQPGGMYAQYVFGTAVNTYTIKWNTSPGSDQITACHNNPTNTAPPSGGTYDTAP